MRKLVDGLLGDTADEPCWHPGRRQCPLSNNDRRTKLTELIPAAPARIPIFGHRYVVADDSQQALSFVGLT